jgi:hypothetical protein
VVIEAVPVPEQSLVATDHRPEGVVEVWLSKPSQNTAPAGHGPPLGWLEGELEGELDGELEGELDGELDGELEGELDGALDGELDGELGVPSPLHSTPSNAKFAGRPLVPEYVAWKPKATVPPLATEPL